MKVGIGRLKTRHSIYVVEYGDYDLVFGQLVLNILKFRQIYKPESIFDTITNPQTLESAVF